MYTVELSTRAEKDLRKLSPDIRKQVIPVIEDLAKNPFPHGSKKLKGPTSDYWRIRTGDYRVIYELIGDGRIIVYVLRVRHRRDVYRGF